MRLRLYQDSIYSKIALYAAFESFFFRTEWNDSIQEFKGNLSYRKNGGFSVLPFSWSSTICFLISLCVHAIFLIIKIIYSIFYVLYVILILNERSNREALSAPCCTVPIMPGDTVRRTEAPAVSARLIRVNSKTKGLFLSKSRAHVNSM